MEDAERGAVAPLERHPELLLSLSVTDGSCRMLATICPGTRLSS
jgi:hypothetical protein